MTDLEQLAKEIIKSNTDLYQKDDDLSRIKDQIRETKNTTNIFKDNESFQEHVNTMRKLVEDEHKQKRNFRRWSTYGALFLVLYSVYFITKIFWYLLTIKKYIPSDSVLIGISVSFVANIIGLANIVFKYVFSSTKETTDYISKIDSHN